MKVRIEHVIVAEKREDAHDQQEYRTNVLPAKTPENTRAVSQHLLDVIREILHAIEPEHSRRFDEHDEQDGQTRTVNIQEFH